MVLTEYSFQVSRVPTADAVCNEPAASSDTKPHLIVSSD